MLGITVIPGNRDNIRGFTLIELMIAIFLLVVGLLSMAGLAISVIQGNNFSKQMTTATTLGQERLETKRVMAFANITSATDKYGTIPGNPSFKRVVTVSAKTLPGGEKYKAITVDTSWAGDSHSVQLKTIVAE